MQTHTFAVTHKHTHTHRPKKASRYAHGNSLMHVHVQGHGHTLNSQSGGLCGSLLQQKSVCRKNKSRETLSHSSLVTISSMEIYENATQFVHSDPLQYMCMHVFLADLKKKIQTFTGNEKIK